MQVVEKIKSHILDSVTFFPFKNRAIYKVIWKKYGRSGQVIGGYGVYALHAGYLRLQMHTQNM